MDWTAEHLQSFEVQQGKLYCLQPCCAMTCSFPNVIFPYYWMVECLCVFCFSIKNKEDKTTCVFQRACKMILFLSLLYDSTAQLVRVLLLSLAVCALGIWPLRRVNSKQDSHLEMKPFLNGSKDAQLWCKQVKSDINKYNFICASEKQKQQVCFWNCTPKFLA